MNKSKEVAKNDSFQRINFLFQVAHLAVKQNGGATSLARFYALTLGSIAKKNVIKLDASIKRTLCRKCFTLLIPGVTATVRTRHRRRRCHQVVTCLECRTNKRFPVRSDHGLWSERPEAWLSGGPLDSQTGEKITNQSTTEQQVLTTGQPVSMTEQSVVDGSAINLQTDCNGDPSKNSHHTTVELAGLT